MAQIRKTCSNFTLSLIFHGINTRKSPPVTDFMIHVYDYITILGHKIFFHTFITVGTETSVTAISCQRLMEFFIKLESCGEESLKVLMNSSSSKLTNLMKKKPSKTVK